MQHSALGVLTSRRRPGLTVWMIEDAKDENSMIRLLRCDYL
jgi:hypothetical protein